MGASPADSRLINADYYGSTAPGRDEYWRKMAAPRFRVATILRLLREQPPGRLVDLGCGNGRLLQQVALRHPGAKLTGIDLSAEQIEANRKLVPGVSWHACDLLGSEAIPLALRGRFDTIVASELIEHVDEPGALLRNALVLAAPGAGRLLLSTQSGRVGETERRVGHHRHFSADEMVALLQSAGWEPVRVWNCGYPFHDLSKWWANRDPDKSMARFSERPYGLYENLICLALRFAFLFNSKSRGAQLFAVARRPGA